MLWAAKWMQKGERSHIIYDNLFPKMFKTRAQCRQWIHEKYGYIKTREDLRGWPHGWRLPVAVKVEVIELTNHRSGEEV